MKMVGASARLAYPVPVDSEGTEKYYVKSIYCKKIRCRPPGAYPTPVEARCEFRERCGIADTPCSWLSEEPVRGFRRRHEAALAPAEPAIAPLRYEAVEAVADEARHRVERAGQPPQAAEARHDAQHRRRVG